MYGRLRQLCLAFLLHHYLRYFSTQKEYPGKKMKGMRLKVLVNDGVQNPFRRYLHARELR